MKYKYTCPIKKIRCPKTQTDNAKSLNSRKSKCIRKLCPLYEFIYIVVDMRIGRLYEPKHESSSPQSLIQANLDFTSWCEGFKFMKYCGEQALYVGRRHRVGGDSVGNSPYEG